MTKLRAILQRRWMILVFCVVIGVGAGVASAQLVKKDSVRNFTVQQVVVANVSQDTVVLVAQDALKVTRGKIPILAAKKLGYTGNIDKLTKSIGTQADLKVGAITIDTVDEDAKEAARRVQAFVDAFLEITNARLQENDLKQLEQVEKNLAASKDQLAKFDEQNPQLTQPGFVPPNDLFTTNLLNARAKLATDIATFTEDVNERELELLRTVPYESLGPQAPFLTATGLIDVPASMAARALLVGVLGLLLGSGLVMLIERVGRRIDTREELVEITDLPILAEIGFVKENRRAIDPKGKVSLEGIWAEPYRRVRSAIQFVQASATAAGGWNAPPGAASTLMGTGPAVFLVTSTSPAEGKSTTSALLALALAEVGVPTVLIGGDFRKPQVDTLVGASRSPSLQDLARLDIERPTVDEIVQGTDFDNLYIAVAGDPTREVTGLVDAAKEVCMESVARGATVVIDSSPLQAANDTLDLLPVVDYVIIVLRAGKSGASDLLDTIETLRRMDSNLLGIVLIGTPAARKQEYYYDYYSHSPVLRGEPNVGSKDVTPVG